MADVISKIMDVLFPNDPRFGEYAGRSLTLSYVSFQGREKVSVMGGSDLTGDARNYARALIKDSLPPDENWF